MKIGILSGCCLWALTFVYADKTIEVKEHILALEQEMAVALIETDEETLTRLWAEDFVAPGWGVGAHRPPRECHSATPAEGR